MGTKTMQIEGGRDKCRNRDLRGAIQDCLLDLPFTFTQGCD